MRWSHKRISGILLTFGAAIALGACGGDAAAPSANTSSPATASSSQGGSEEAPERTAGAEVELIKFAFDPDPVTVEMGETITWVNGDDILHTVTSGRPQEQGVPGVSANKDSAPDGLFDQELEFEDTFSFTFEEPGKVTYFCNIHPGMTGIVEVK